MTGSIPTTETMKRTSDYRDNKEGPAGFERLESRAKQRTRFVDRMPQSQRRGKNRQPIEMEFENIKVAEISAFEQRFIARKHDPELGLHHAVLIFVTDPHHQCRLPV